MKKFIYILITTILAIGILTGCSNVPEATEAVLSAVPAAQSIQPEEIIVPEPIGTEGPGYGAEGSFENPDSAVEQMLLYAIQDEYLARAEYEYLIEELDAATPFTNIIKAEENHISMLIPLFETYNIELPEDTSAEHLIPASSITEALETGVLAEVNNIAMYDQFLENDLPDDIRTIFTSLRDASKSHLAAFERKLSR